MCVIIPDEEVLIEWAKNNGLTEKFAELCQSEVNVVPSHLRHRIRKCVFSYSAEEIRCVFDDI